MPTVRSWPHPLLAPVPSRSIGYSPTPVPNNHHDCHSLKRERERLTHVLSMSMVVINKWRQKVSKHEQINMAGTRGVDDFLGI